MKAVKKDFKNQLSQAPFLFASGKDFYLLSSIIFVLTFLYFLIAAGHIPAFQEEQFLFLFTGEYFNSFSVKPGGLLEYAGRFLMQLYSIPTLAAFELAIVLVLPGVLAHAIIKKLNPGQMLVIPLAILPAVMLILMQNQYYHFMEYNLGYSVILTYFLLTYKYRKIWLNIILFPLLYYITGAFSLIYILFELVYSIVYYKGPRKITIPFILILSGGLAYFIFREILFLVPDKALLTYPLPIINERFHRVIFVLLTVYISTFPVLGFSPFLVKSRAKIKRYTGVVSGGFIIAIASFIIYTKYDRTISNVMNIQNEAYKGEWDEVIRMHEESPAGNLISQFFYNTALSEKGVLCDKLFISGQDFGTKSLILPWGDQYLERGAYFFFTSGLVNEAHRWAYEEMVVYGMRPHNLEMLIKTSLLDGNFRIAEKYINILNKTAFYRDDAKKYGQMLINKESILADTELGPVSKILPEKDFFIYLDSPEDNLPMLFESNPANRRAFEYMMAWLLLEKDVETVISNLHLLKDLGYTRIPRNIEEAIMIYYDSQKVLPDLEGLTISPETLTRFKQYFGTFVNARKNPVTLQQTMSEQFGDTFWYYFHFNQ